MMRLGEEQGWAGTWHEPIESLTGGSPRTRASPCVFAHLVRSILTLREVLLAAGADSVKAKSDDH
jgi:hypothetical protein